MPPPISYTALLLAGSISTGDPEMDTYLIESSLKAKYRAESVMLFDMALHKAETERSRVLLGSWEGRFYRNHFLNFSGIINRKVVAYTAAHTEKDKDSKDYFIIAKSEL